MVETASQMLPVGTRAPSFSLTDAVSGKTVDLDDFGDDRVLVVMFICNHCPYVKHIKESLAEFSREYVDSGLGMVAISANDVEEYPTDGPDHMKAEAQQYGYEFPYLYDEEQTVAAAYTAMCTPDFFLFDSDNKLVYRGRYDESRPDSGIPVTGKDLKTAVDAVLSGESVSEDQHPSMGCSIKWKSGQTPAYFTS